MINHATITAIIPTFRRWNHLLSTIEQLLDQTRIADEIIVIDQTPQDEIEPTHVEQLGQLQTRHESILYHHQTEPRVYRARNVAAAMATSDLLLYLDDDVLLDKRLVEYHLSILADTEVDAVVGRVTNQGIDRSKLGAPPRNASCAEIAFTFGAHRDDVRRSGIAYCVAGNFCVRREVLAGVGGWDEHILTYGDKDMGLRLHAAGRNIVYDPRPTLLHLVTPSGGTRLSDPRAPWLAWQRAVSIHYVALRHLKGKDLWRFGLVRAAHHTFLLRRNVVRPWRWLPELWGYAKGLAIARRWARGEILSCYPRNDRARFWEREGEAPAEPLAQRELRPPLAGASPSHKCTRSIGSQQTRRMTKW